MFYNSGMEFLLENVFWVGLACVSLAGISWTLRRDSVSSIDPSEAVLWLKKGKGIVVDVRAAAEYARGRIPLSRNIPSEELGGRMGELEKFRERPVLLVCATGTASGKSARELAAKGFAQVRAMRGGMGAWVQAQMPIFKK